MAFFRNFLLKIVGNTDCASIHVHVKCDVGMGSSWDGSNTWTLKRPDRY